MRNYVIACLLVVGLAIPAWAATENMYFVTVDTVGNCSVSQGKPSAGQDVIGEKGGYESMEAAEKKLEEVRNDEATCKGVVE